MEQRISLITLGVADVAASRAFYERLGWRASERWSSQDIAFFDMGGIVLALFGRDALAEDAAMDGEAAGLGGMAVAQNVRSREAVDEALEEARNAGGHILKLATEADWGGYSGYFADPDGHAWEIAWNPLFPLDDNGHLFLPA